MILIIIIYIQLLIEDDVQHVILRC